MRVSLVLSALVLAAFVGGCRKTEIRESRPIVTQPAPVVVEHDRPHDVIIEHH